jgi:hypothetical protein
MISDVVSDLVSDDRDGGISMNKLSDTSPVDGNSVTAILEGGPTDLPQGSRNRRVASSERKVKILHRGGYEHFELVDEYPGHGDPSAAIFRWTMRTKIAE